MAGVGEEGRTDDVMREEHRERTVTVPTCASFPSGLEVFSFILCAAEGKKKMLTPILIYRCILLVHTLSQCSCPTVYIFNSALPY